MPETRWFQNGAKIAKSRRTRTAVEALLDGLELVGADLLTAELARSAADVVDAARRAQDPKLWLSASQRLEGLVRRLPAAGVPGGADTGAGEVTKGDGDDGAGGGADPAAELEELVGRGPSMGDQA